MILWCSMADLLLPGWFMQRFIKRYARANKFKGINNLSLFAWNMTPRLIRQLLVQLYYRTHRDRLPGVLFLILAQGRTGSSLLVDLLNSHPDISCLAEIFTSSVAKNVRNPVDFASGLCCLSTNNAGGFKVKIYQMGNVRCSTAHQFLERFRDEGWQVIYLKRANVLRHALSDIRSEKTRIFHHTGEKEEGKLKSARKEKVTITEEELFRTIRFREKCLEQEKEALAGIDHMVIEYERDLLEDDSKLNTMDRVFDYLGLKPHTCSTAMKKVTSRNISDIVENHQEIIDSLTGTPYEEYLGWG